MSSGATAILTPPKASLRRGPGLLVNRPAGIPLSAEDIEPTQKARPSRVALIRIIGGRTAMACPVDGRCSKALLA